MRFVETPHFVREIDRLLSDEEYRALQNAILENTHIGNVIVGTGGARKMRWARGNSGKSGGIRVVYVEIGDTIWLLLAFAKNSAATLSDAGKKELKKLIERLKNVTENKSN
ncbi:MAG: hypothetical protein RLZZ156_1159 [Deinococcota bacterium]|jgi:hypothetical protein